MTEIEKVIRSILDCGLKYSITHNMDFNHSTIRTEDENVRLYLYPDGFAIPIPDYVLTAKDLCAKLKDLSLNPGREKYFIYLNKDEHFNYEVQGVKVLPFELNNLALDVYELSNKLKADNVQ